MPTCRGRGGFLPAAADYDGDGRADPAVYAEGPSPGGPDSGGHWHGWLSGHGYASAQRSGYLGGPGWAPAPADFDGDGRADPAVYREAPSSAGPEQGGSWRIRLSGAGYAETLFDQLLGGPDYSAAAADFDGDRCADPAVYGRADGVWLVLLSGSGYAPFALDALPGGAGWNAVPGDYDGDGRADPAVFHPASGDWRFLLSRSGYAPLLLPQFLGRP